MNMSYEFSKIRDSFKRVREDMQHLASKIGENYEQFITHHKKLAHEIATIKEEFNSQINVLKERSLTDKNHISEKDFYELKSMVKELKTQVSSMQKDHSSLIMNLEDVRREKGDIKELKEKFKSSELELFLLKERLKEKDTEIEQIKQVNEHMYAVLNELSELELAMLNSKERS